jgi:hypothetical protein
VFQSGIGGSVSGGTVDGLGRFLSGDSSDRGVWNLPPVEWASAFALSEEDFTSVWFKTGVVRVTVRTDGEHEKERRGRMAQNGAKWQHFRGSSSPISKPRNDLGPMTETGRYTTAVNIFGVR